MIKRRQPVPHGYLTSDQASRSLGISKRTLHRWGRQRKGPPRIKIGRNVLYRQAALEAWLLQNEETYSGEPGCTGGKNGTC